MPVLALLKDRVAIFAMRVLAAFIDDNGVSSFVDDNGVTAFTDDIGH